MRKLVAAIAIGLLSIVSVGAALPPVGTVTVTRRNIATGVSEFTIAWTSSAGGAVSGNSFEIGWGRIETVKFVPGSGGTQPTDLYDATVVDTNSVDLLQGTGANLSNATAAIVQFNPGVWQNGRQAIDLVIANAGNAKTGTAIITVLTR